MTYDDVKGLCGRPIAFQSAFVALGGVKVALFLSQACYWTEVKHGDWFYKTTSEWEQETGLTRWEQEEVRRKLRELGVLEEDRIGPRGTLHYRVDFECLQSILAGRMRKNHIVEKPHSGKTTVRKNLASVCGKTSVSNVEKPRSLTYSENTASITPETTCSDASENGSEPREIRPDGTCRLTDAELAAQERACDAIGKLSVNLKDAERRAVSRLFASGCPVALWEQVVSETATPEVGSLVYFVKICETRLKEIQSNGEQARQPLRSKHGPPPSGEMVWSEAALDFEREWIEHERRAKAFAAERRAAKELAAKGEAK